MAFTGRRATARAGHISVRSLSYLTIEVYSNTDSFSALPPPSLADFGKYKYGRGYSRESPRVKRGDFAKVFGEFARETLSMEIRIKQVECELVVDNAPNPAQDKLKGRVTATGTSS